MTTRTSQVAPSDSGCVSVKAVERHFATPRTSVHALGPVDLTLGEGEFVCIVGPSGCGKSTLLRIIAGLITPSSGTVEIVHHDPSRPLTGVVFQDHSIYPWKSVEDNVRFGLDVQRSVPRSRRREIVQPFLEMTGLADFAQSYPAELSGGMRQRVAIARTLAVNPEILLMDEPFASLDAQLRTVMQEELLRLWEADPRTVVFVTHSIEEALLLGDRVVVMSARPGVIRADHAVDIPRPRTRDARQHPRYQQLYDEIWEVIREEVNANLMTSKQGG